MKQNKISQNEILNALKIYKGLPVPLTKLEYEQAKTLLSKRITLADAFSVIEVLTYPYNKQVSELNKRLSVTGMTLDKLAKHLRVHKATMDKLWGESTDEFDKANKEQIAKMKAEFKKLAEENKNKGSKEKSGK
jgi:hypothetical protein